MENFCLDFIPNFGRLRIFHLESSNYFSVRSCAMLEQNMSEKFNGNWVHCFGLTTHYISNQL